MSSMASTAQAVQQTRRARHLVPGLRARRKARNLSAVQLATLTGYTRQHISGLECQVFGASEECLTRLADALDCDETELTGRMVEAWQLHAGDRILVNDTARTAMVEVIVTEIRTAPAGSSALHELDWEATEARRSDTLRYDPTDLVCRLHASRAVAA